MIIISPTRRPSSIKHGEIAHAEGFISARAE